MYNRTTFRLGEGIDRIMRWMMRAKIPAVKLSWLLAIFWLSLIGTRIPDVIGLITNAMAMGENTNEVASKMERANRMHVSSISEAVARKFEPPSSTRSID